MKSRIRLIHRIVLVSVLFILLLCLTACQESTSSKYERANKLLSEGKYTEAAAIFDEITTYEDASKMSLYAKAINAAETGDYETAFSTFSSLGEFKDSQMMLTYYKGKQNEASANNGAVIQENKWFDAIELYESIPLFRDSKDRAESCRKAAYDQAIKSGDEGNISLAISILQRLGTYSDAAKQVTYYQAVILLNQGDYSGASRAFSTIPGFRDADNRVTSVQEEGYKAAIAKEEAGELDEANSIFLNLGEYKDSADRAYKLYYDDGIAKREAGDWDGARAAFTKAGAYSDAVEQIIETTYQEAAALGEDGELDRANSIFLNLGEYKDSADRAYKLYYDDGITKREAGNWDGARAAFAKAGEYSDTAEQIVETAYQEAASAYMAGEFEKAYSIYSGIKGYKDVDTLLENDNNFAAPAAAAAAREAKLAPYRMVGSIVTFGTYPQTEEGTDQTPIEWIVLDYDEANHKALLLSKYGLDAVPYNREHTAITWEQCSLRTWLNKQFLNKAFNAKEQSAILVTNVDNSSSQRYKWERNISGGNNTQDQVFLLSYAEANRYLGVTTDDNTKASTTPTAYVIAHGVWKYGEYKTADGWWWLRSLYDKGYAEGVGPEGGLRTGGVGFEFGCVRPAFWLNLESDFF